MTKPLLQQHRFPSAQDWNTMLDAFSNLEFCVAGNGTFYYQDDRLMAAPDSPSAQFHDSDDSSGADKGTGVDKGSTVNSPGHIFSIMLNVHLTLVSSIQQYADSNLLLRIVGRQLGNKGIQSQVPINVTFRMPTLDKVYAKCKPPDCDDVTIPICVTFQSMLYSFPKIRMPSKCSAGFPSSDSLKRPTWSLSWRVASSFLNSLHCRNNLKMRLVYALDPQLTHMLSAKDKENIEFNLQICCIILAIFISSILLYGSMYRSHSIQRQQSQQINDNISLKDIIESRLEPFRKDSISESLIGSPR